MSESKNNASKKSEKVSLNPFSSGGWCRRYTKLFKIQIFCKVLILFLVEDGVGVETKEFDIPTGKFVLILFLVEDGVGEQKPPN